MLIRMLVKRIVIAGALMFASPVVFAGFATYSKEWPNDADSVGENVPAASSNKKKEIKKQVSNDCDDQKIISNDCDEQKIKKFCDNQRLYFKFGINTSKAEIKDIENKSNDQLAGLPINISSIQDSGFDWEIGVGSKIEQLRFELEYLNHKTLNYNPSPVLIGNDASLASDINNYALLVNMYWDFDNLGRFKPYIGVLTGVVWNKTYNVLTGGGVGNGNPEYENNYGLAWGLTIGTRIPFYSNWYCYFGYRYTSQSKVIWKDNTSVLNLEGKYTFSGLNLGLNYVI